MKAVMGKVQLGKQGITDNFISGLQNCFKTHENVKVSVLKSAGHDRDEVKKMSEEIINKLGKKYTAKVIGFTINVKKWRKARK